MTLGRRLTLQAVVVAVAILVLAVATLLSLARLDVNLSAALHEYDRLRWCYQTGIEVTRVRDTLAMAEQLRSSGPQPQERLLGVLLQLEPTAVNSAAEDLRVRVQPLLQASLAALHADPSGTGRQIAISKANEALNVLVGGTQRVRQRIREIQVHAATAQRQAVILLGALALLLLTLVSLAGVVQYRAVMRPLEKLRTATQRLARGAWDQPAQPTGDQEFAALAVDFNRMADQLRSVYQDLEEKVRVRGEQLARSERLAAVGLLAAGVAHEINNPLATISGQAELALRRQPPDTQSPAHSGLELIRDEAFRCKEITQRLLELARPTPAQPVVIDLGALVETVIAATAGLADRSGCQVACDTPKPAPIHVHADETEIKQVLINLMLNALAATPPGQGNIEVRVESQGSEAVVSVRDHGEGMDAATLAQVFEPFFTRRRASGARGTGLGLSVSHTIVTQHGGRLEAHSPGPGAGSCFRVYLPLSPVPPKVHA